VSREESPTQELFASLDGQEFRNYVDFDQAVDAALRAHRSAFPLTYTPRQAISWARQNGWIKDSSDGLVIEVH
jgi:hypothetical protein